MNTQQKKYAIAKANLETATQLMQEYEADWLKAHGRTEKYIFTVRNHDEFEKLNAEYGADETAQALFSEECKAIDLLSHAENELIEYGLSIIPDALTDIIRKGIKNYKYRERFIEMTFNLETQCGKREVKRQLEALYSKMA